MPECEFSEAKSGGVYGYCSLVMTEMSSSWYSSLCIKNPSKCPYIKECPKCGMKNAAFSPFCSECRAKLKE